MPYFRGNKLDVATRLNSFEICGEIVMEEKMEIDTEKNKNDETEMAVMKERQ